MAIGKRKPKQRVLWVANNQIAAAGKHPFYSRLNRLLAADGFDTWAEELCSPYFAESGRPSIPPGVYFRIVRQCELLSLNRSVYHYRPTGETALNLELKRLIDSNI